MSDRHSGNCRPEEKSGGNLRMGKLPEALLRRSVLRPLASVLGKSGEECEADSMSAYAVVGSLPGFECMPGLLVTAAVNKLAAAGAVPQEILLHVILSRDYEEKCLQRDMRQISEQARKYHMTVVGGHTEVSYAVKRCIYSATAIGRVSRENHKTEVLLCPGQELIVTKWIALAGTVAAVNAHEDELRERYPASLVDAAKGFGEMLCVLDEAQIAVQCGAYAMRDVSQGGIFGTLWEMADCAEVGLEIDLKQIPIRQETVEICEYFDLNPYCLYSAGSLIIGTKQGEALIEAMTTAGIPAVTIGCVTSGRERIIRNGEGVRYLDRPQQDEWYRRFGE